MTKRLFVLWLRMGALTLMVCAAAVMVFCLIALGVLFMASQAHHGAQVVADVAVGLALASVFSWAGGALMLAVALWLFLESIIRSFKPRAFR